MGNWVNGLVVISAVLLAMGVVADAADGFTHLPQREDQVLVEVDGSHDCNKTLTPNSKSYQKVVPVARRKLGLFSECALCECCTDSTRLYCHYTACCYTIDCFSPDLPFGHCLFTPVACSCFSCSP